MRREWDLDDLIASWTLIDADQEQLVKLHEGSRLSFALMVKFFEIEGRFPRHGGELPPVAVDFVARQLGVRADAPFEVTGRAVERFRVQIREMLGFRVFTRGDEDKMIAWLASEVCPSELNEDRQREAVLARCRVERVEPPGRMGRIVGSANRIADERFCATIVGRLSAEVAQSLWALIVDAGDDVDGEVGFFGQLKADPGKLGLETLLAEITKLRRIRAIGLPADLFADVSPRRVTRWRERCAGVFPSTLRRDHSPPVMLTLLAVLCWCRLTEVTDSLVELFVDLVRAINTRAERRVDKAQLAEFRRVRDKENVLFTMAGVSVAHPDGLVREVVYPAVGEQTLKDLVAEAKATESRRRAQVRTVLAGSYSHYYRTMLPKLLDALEFRCNNTAYRPVMDAIDLLHRYKDRDGRLTHYEPGERVPLDGVVKPEWRAAVVDERGRVERIGFELSAIGALRDALRRGEIWVVGSRAWRNPETHLPVDFDLNRDVHYEAIAQPIDPTQFVTSLRTRLDTSLARWAEAMRAGTAGTKVGTRKNQVWISVSKAGAQPVPEHLDEVKETVIGRWGVVSLLDLLKEADFLTGFTGEFTSIATRERLDPAELRKRLLLILFALGTNIGIKRIVNSGAHGVTESQLRGTRRTYVTRDGLRRAIAAVVGETLRGRDPRWWGTGTACASDSKKFGSWESNLMTEWSIRYGGTGGIAYHYVSDTYIALFSKFIPVGVWEAVHIIQGLLDQQSKVKPDTIHADTQGQALPVYALAHLCGFELMPRVRNWKDLNFYRVSAATRFRHIEALFGEPGRNVIDWDLIERHYDDLMRVVLSVAAGKISSVTLLRRLSTYSRRNNFYKAFREVGRVIRTIQLLRYLSDPQLRRRTTAATNKVESYNNFSAWCRFGNEGRVRDNDPAEQEKQIKFSTLLTNAVIFHTTLDMMMVLRQLTAEGWEIKPEDLAVLSPYLTMRINRFGVYATDEITATPEQYDAHLPGIDLTLCQFAVR